MATRKFTITTAADIAVLPATGQSYRAWDTRQPGLCVRATAAGVKTWSYKYRVNGKQQTFAIAPADPSDPKALTPGQARKKAKLLGADPAGERREAEAQRKAEKLAAARAAQRTIRAFLEGDYWMYTLSRKRDGAGARKRIEKAWADLLDKDMAEIVKLDLERVRRKRLKSGITPQTLNRDWTALRALLNAAVEADLIESFPRLPKLEVPKTAHVRYLGEKDLPGQKAPGERERFIAAANDPRTERHLQVLVWLAYYTGARRGELFGLVWGKVSFTENMITLEAHTSKSNKTRRVPMHSELRKILLEWHREQGGPQGDVLVVPSPRNGLGRLVTVQKGWAALLDRAGIAGFRFHDLRHHADNRIMPNRTADNRPEALWRCLESA